MGTCCEATNATGTRCRRGIQRNNAGTGGARQRPVCGWVASCRNGGRDVHTVHRRRHLRLRQLARLRRHTHEETQEGASMENLCDLRWSQQRRTFLILISEFFLFHTSRGRAADPRPPLGFEFRIFWGNVVGLLDDDADRAGGDAED